MNGKSETGEVVRSDYEADECGLYLNGTGGF